MDNKKTLQQPRNDTRADWWSLLHIVWAALFCVIWGPVIAFIIMLLWEPLEIFVLAKVLRKRYGIVFGHESLRNSLYDIIFNLIGIMVGYYLIMPLL